MKRMCIAVLGLLISLFVSGQELTKPADFFGFEPGNDRKLFNYEQLITYLQKLDGQSDRIHMQEIGASPEGRPMYICFISSAENLARLDELKEINRRLALEAELDEGEMDAIAEKGRAFVLATLSMHSTEVAPSQSAPLVAREFAGTADPQKLEWLDNVVYMMVPCHNPDGMNMIVNHYNENVGSRYEGASYPGVYHKYVGHDNNRDFVILSQEDTRAIAGIYNLNWFPQVMVEKHQMGSTGTRYFVPPNHDPIAENVPAGILHWSGVFGQHMATDMTAEGLAGVSQHYLFDDYWPGSTETCIWKNVIGFLTEAASVQTASPIYIEPTELGVYGKGLSEYKKSINMLLPWEGGWWRLGDIVEYEMSSTMSIIKTASLYHEDILRFRHRMTAGQVALGKTEAPFYYIMPREQHDQGELVKLVNLLKEHGVKRYELKQEMVLDGKVYGAGDVVIPLAQPFRPFIKEVMESQVFPERHYTPGGELIKPYDITSWSLPLHRHVKSHEISIRSLELEAQMDLIEDDYSLAVSAETMGHSMILPVKANESFRAAFRALGKDLQVERLQESMEVKGESYEAGSFVIRLDPKKKGVWMEILEELPFTPGMVLDKRAIPGKRMCMPRVALVETHFHDMDAGWTRFLFDTYHLPYTVLHPGEIAGNNLAEDFDVLIFPDNDKEMLMSGKQKKGGSYYMGSYHPDYVKGIGKEGMKKIMEFSRTGGVILAWGRSSSLFQGMLSFETKEGKEEFSLPFQDQSSALAAKGLYVPGSLVKLVLKDSHPLTLGMPEEIGVFSRGRPVFSTSVPRFDLDRRVVGTFPEKDVVMSGYGDKTELMGAKAAMIWMRKGKGQFVFYGFQPQFRASTQASFKLVFNAVLLEKRDQD